MSVGKKTAEDAGPAEPKPSSSARFDRLLSGLGAGGLVDIEPDKLKSDIQRWAKAVAALVRQLSFGAWPEKSDSSSDHQKAGGER
ncbi:uncharacterized protein LOC112271113 [Brachypodium distachyon]|uniref:Uncharacterized protein n=1 Tax=Brachypodium distachyon TaxID=15368 RepID=I1HQT4_BRADI|nr:uncharacterized protein LOC112271113 [Brachypodium distachyon]KQK09401.1 hypothetical protein BRADI_2g47770v3 [Brachypodium distachyon]|eukprot:XP_024315879.1 uncharacterized protein LOC112271113 [Brachypodium distachyon]